MHSSASVIVGWVFVRVDECIHKVCQAIVLGHRPHTFESYSAIWLKDFQESTYPI